jgi:hypothetical protein
MGYKNPRELKYGLRGPTVGKTWVTMTHRRYSFGLQGPMGVKVWVTRTHGW